MPIDNLGNVHFTEAQLMAINEALQVLQESIAGITRPLTPKERSKYGKVGDQKELLIDKVKDYYNVQRSLSSPEVDWDEFQKDYSDRKHATQMLFQIRNIETMLMDIKFLRDHDNFTDALRDYQYAQYKNRFSNAFGFETKVNTMKVFFPRTGKRGKKGDDKTDTL